MLMLLAHFGEQTGYPTLRVKVDGSANLKQDADYLILGAPDDQPAFARISQQLPVVVKEDGFSIHDTGGFFASLQEQYILFDCVRPHNYAK